MEGPSCQHENPEGQIFRGERGKALVWVCPKWGIRNPRSQKSSTENADTNCPGLWNPRGLTLPPLRPIFRKANTVRPRRYFPAYRVTRP